MPISLVGAIIWPALGRAQQLLLRMGRGAPDGGFPLRAPPAVLPLHLVLNLQDRAKAHPGCLQVRLLWPHRPRDVLMGVCEPVHGQFGFCSSADKANSKQRLLSSSSWGGGMRGSACACVAAAGLAACFACCLLCFAPFAGWISGLGPSPDGFLGWGRCRLDCRTGSGFQSDWIVGWLSGSQSVWIHRLVERLWAGAGWISRLSTDIECLGICVCVCPLCRMDFRTVDACVHGCSWTLVSLLRLHVARECVCACVACELGLISPVAQAIWAQAQGLFAQCVQVCVRVPVGG